MHILEQPSAAQLGKSETFGCIVYLSPQAEAYKGDKSQTLSQARSKLPSFVCELFRLDNLVEQDFFSFLSSYFSLNSSYKWAGYSARKRKPPPERSECTCIIVKRDEVKGNLVPLNSIKHCQ